MMFVMLDHFKTTGKHLACLIVASLAKKTQGVKKILALSRTSLSEYVSLLRYLAFAFPRQVWVPT